uniref:Uncharacterized protein n=1 Tax=Aotus nancymaae TaxID=37293 RepID=A0A2K5CXF2_AOTNA
MKNKAKWRVLGHSSAQRVPGGRRSFSPHPLTPENWVFSQYCSTLYSKVHCRHSNSPFLFPLPPASFSRSELVMSLSISNIMLLKF